MQYKSLMGIWPDSLLPSESLACETIIELASYIDDFLVHDVVL